MRMKSKSSKIFSGLLALVLALTMMVGVMPMSASANSYNSDAAVSFANAHWNDGIGLCAEFVSRCLNAGGIKIPNYAYYSSNQKSYANNSGTLGNYTNPYMGSAPLLLYLSESYEIITNPSNSDIEVGDVVFMYSKDRNGNLKWKDGHVGICVKKVGGSPRYAAHNRAAQEASFSSGYPCTYVAKMGGNPVTHTVDLSYGNNFTAYPKARITAENIFDANHNQISSTAWIGTSDMCTIHEVYTDGCCKVSYPLDSGETKTVYSKFSLFDINVHTHSYTSTVTAPTCTSQGYTTHTCSCGDSYTDSYVPALGHSDGAWVTTVEPTCLGEGTEKIYCTRCNAELNSRQIAPLGHDYASEVVTEATCKGKGQMKYVCKRCEFTYYDVIPAKGHNHEEAIWVTTVAPTCTASGEQSAYCPDCNELIETRAVEALGHDDGKWVITSQPGCESKGEETCYCTRCGKVIDSRQIDALGHDDGTWVVVTKPTCREDGQEVLFCTRCGKAIDKRTVNALGHDEGVWKIDFEPTANHDGQMSRYCTRCDEVLETKSFKMHTHREGYRETVTEATCTTDGIGGIFCADCGAKYDTYVISALGHDYNDWYMNNNGTHSRTCSRCHNFESENCDFEVTVKEATCTEAGYTTHVCKICGYTYVDGNVDALGHAWGEWVDDGNGETHTRTCSGCGITETEEHHWGEWKLNKDATLFKNGTKTRVCPDCGATETIGSIHTAWLVRIPYTIVLWIGNILKKVLYILSFQWFLPNHGIPPIH